jgi:hypothetical protein
MLIKKDDNGHIEGPIDGQNGSHTVAVQEKLQLPEDQLQEISGSGPIEIRIYEDQVSDSGRMMLKISFAKQEIRRFTRR